MMTADTRTFRMSDAAALSVGAVTGIAGSLALFQVIKSARIDINSVALQTGQALVAEGQAMGIPFVEASPAYWYVARAGGILAYLLLWFAVFWGITMSSKMAKGAVGAKLIYGLHEFFPILAVIFTALHAAVLIGDSTIEFTVANLLIPFASPYEPLWTGLGVLAFYLIVALVVSFYVRTWIGPRTWRSFHYVSYIAFVLALVHGVQSGTDSGTMAMQWVYGVTAALILFATWFRILTVKARSGRVSRALS